MIPAIRVERLPRPGERDPAGRAGVFIKMHPVTLGRIMGPQVGLYVRGVVGEDREDRCADCDSSSSWASIFFVFLSIQTHQ